MNLRRSSMWLPSFQGTFALPQKAQLCNPCLRNELSPFSQEGHCLQRVTYEDRSKAPCHGHSWRKVYAVFVMSMTVKALPGSSPEVIETEFFFQLLVSLF